MDIREMITHVDHTLLKQTATWEQIKTLCEEGIRYGTASVCIPPYYVERAKAFVEDRLPICTVIGFPNGYSTTASKAYETEEAIENGADEIDVVINLGMVKEQKWNEITEELVALRDVSEGKILKVIIETCLLTEQEKIKMCELVTNCQADYIKTSTGFSTGGATFEDVQLFARYIGSNVKIKAAGGIHSLEDAQKFLELGADRLGTSKIVSLMQNNQPK